MLDFILPVVAFVLGKYWKPIIAALEKYGSQREAIPGPPGGPGFSIPKKNPELNLNYGTPKTLIIKIHDTGIEYKISKDSANIDIVDIRLRKGEPGAGK